MPDIIDRNRELDARYRDQGDGTYAPPEASLGYAWDATNSVWIRVTADSSPSGALNVNSLNILPLLSAAFSLNSTGTVVAAVPAKRIKVYSIILDSTTTGSATGATVRRRHWRAR